MKQGFRKLSEEIVRVNREHFNHVEPSMKVKVVAIHQNTLDVIIPKDRGINPPYNRMNDVPVLVPILGPADYQLNIELGDMVYLIFPGGHISNPMVIGKLASNINGD